MQAQLLFHKPLLIQVLRFIGRDNGRPTLLQLFPYLQTAMVSMDAASSWHRAMASQLFPKIAF